MLKLLRSLLDTYTLLLFAMILLASLWPAEGQAEVVMTWVTRLAIALLFFLQGARLSRRAIWDGILHWRLHLLAFAFTFIGFPLLGLAFWPLYQPLLGESLALGVLYLCVLPGTVQSAIAFTALARGNLAAAVCNASASSLIGILITPLLVWLLLGLDTSAAGFSFFDTLKGVSLQLLLPFITGHGLRPWVANWVEQNRSWLGRVDQTSILLVVYTAFSASVVAGLWQTIALERLLLLTLFCSLLLALVLWLTTQLARRLGFNRQDEIALVFCASKKSMATGVPLAQLLFSAHLLGPMLLPLMIFHQIQLMVGAHLAKAYLKQAETKNP